jgi:DNA replication protein DnaC
VHLTGINGCISPEYPFTDETVADAFIDRVIHTGHRIELKGDSLRKKG